MGRFRTHFPKLFLSLFLLTDCTTVGFHREAVRNSLEYGKTQTLKVCVWKDENVSLERISSLMDSWNDELALYRLRAETVQITDWKRRGWTGIAILEDLVHAPLPEGCDRILAFAGAKSTDYFYQIAQIVLAFFFIPLPEVLGAVDRNTGSRGYVLAHWFSLNQLLWSAPSATLVHEGYHLLGCGHSLFLSECYTKIREIKEAGLTESARKDLFFPAKNPKGGYFLQRKDLNSFFLGE
ncbi:hypothetical protein EHO61_15915 [Leptospira fluminis]|uniref:Uncharacterized protein n=2 Tax=Leptospira fluminis TaxID=2484979 RepID=A0A4R9GMX9_9LEPT|nr:hypothetical protein EHO61_15915 [Leptospira fluminis]